MKEEVAAELVRRRRHRVVAPMHGLAVDGNTSALSTRRFGLCNDVVSGRHIDRVATVRAVERVHVQTGQSNMWLTAAVSRSPRTRGDDLSRTRRPPRRPAVRDSTTRMPRVALWRALVSGQ